MSSTFYPERDLPIVRYLLGDLPDQEAEEIEERSFCDPAVLEQIEIVEEQLVREYLDQTLAPAYVPLFERRCAAVPALREKVEFARLLRQAHSVPAQAGVHSVARKRRAWFGNNVLAIAAAGVVVLGPLLWLTIENARLRTQVASSAPAKTGAATSVQVGPSQILAVVLTPGLEKAVANGEPRQFPIAPGVTEVRISFELPGLAGDPLVGVDVMLVEPAGRRKVVSREGLRTSATTTGRTVLLVLRPEELPSGDYLTFVRRSSGPPEESTLESYAFSVLRR